MVDEPSKNETEMVKRTRMRSSGARNLVILGVVSILLAISTTSVSLALYHNSGDIYLDRSRPGYLPDKAEIEEEEGKEPEEEYTFEKSGKLSGEVLEEYLKELDKEIQAIDSYERPFYEDVLSDKNLGIIDNAANSNELNNNENLESAPQVEEGA